MRSLHQQKGDFLIEAMIGTLITALVSLGTLAITSHVLLTQEEMTRQETIVTLAREQLYGQNRNDAAKNLCSSEAAKTSAAQKFSVLKRGNVAYTVSCPEKVTEKYSLNGKPLTEVELPLVYVSVKVPVPGKKENYEYSLGVEK
jgi:hypothetical protein